MEENKKRLLIVEDSPTLQHTYPKILKMRKPDLHIDIAKNGEEAVEKIRTSKDYNAIIMDIDMPIMGGVEAARKIRKLGYLGTILANTTLYHEEAKTAMIQGQMDGFILKQLGIDKLIAYLEKYSLI